MQKREKHTRSSANEVRANGKVGGEKGHAHSNVKQDNNNATRGSELDIWTYYLKRKNQGFWRSK